MSKATTHESVFFDVWGSEIYTDEQHPPEGLLSLYPVQAPHAHARIVKVDASRALLLDGVVDVANGVEARPAA